MVLNWWLDDNDFRSMIWWR